MAYSAFLSHSMTQEDPEFVRGITDALNMHKIRCYIAERDVQAGAPLVKKVEQAIRDCDCPIALLTRGGLQSKYVNTKKSATPRR